MTPDQDRKGDMVTVWIIHSAIESGGTRVTTTIFRDVDPAVAEYVRDQVAAGKGIDINDGACVIPADTIRDFRITGGWLDQDLNKVGCPSCGKTTCTAGLTEPCNG